MANVPMNIDSAVWAHTGGNITFLKEQLAEYKFGGVIKPLSSGSDKHITDAPVVERSGLYVIGYNDRTTFFSLSGKEGDRATMVLKILDSDADTGVQLTIVNSTLIENSMNVEHNVHTQFVATYYAYSVGADAHPVTVVAF